MSCVYPKTVHFWNIMKDETVPDIEALQAEIERLKKENEALRSQSSKTETSDKSTQTADDLKNGLGGDFTIDLEDDNIKEISLGDSFNVDPFEVKTEPVFEEGPPKVAYANGEETLGHMQIDKLDALRRIFETDVQLFSDILWKFLLGLLLDRDQKCIKWTGREWEFYLPDREEVARLWGVQKRRPNMTYEKMSRGLRFYYTEGIVTKCQERFTYRFGDKHLTALLQKEPKFNDDSRLDLIENYSPEIEEVSEFKAITTT